MLQGPLSHRIFTGKKNIGLCTCFATGCGLPFPSLVLSCYNVGVFFLSPSSSSSSPSFLFPFSLPTADICTPTMFALQKRKFRCLLYLPLYLGDIFPKWQQSRTLSKANCLWMPSFLGCVPRVKFKMTLPGWRSGSMATTEAPETPSSCENWQTTEPSGFYVSSGNLWFVS